MTAKILYTEENRADDIVSLTLRESSHTLIHLDHESTHLLTACTEHNPDIVILNISTLSEKTLAQIHETNQVAPHPIIIFSSDRCKSTIANVIKAGVSAYVVDDMAAHRIGTIIEIAINRFNDRQNIKNELETTKTKLAHRQFVERAKGILIETRGLTENEAYHTLRKLAMDRKIAIGEMAKNVISMANLLEDKKH